MPASRTGRSSRRPRRRVVLEVRPSSRAPIERYAVRFGAVVEVGEGEPVREVVMRRWAKPWCTLRIAGAVKPEAWLRFVDVESGKPIALLDHLRRDAGVGGSA